MRFFFVFAASNVRSDPYVVCFLGEGGEGEAAAAFQTQVPRQCQSSLT